eukprot:5944878-Ditylum_brightwellii.AAC.1
MQFETRDCYNCGEKCGTVKSHIAPQCPLPQKLCAPDGGRGCRKNYAHGGGRSQGDRGTYKSTSGDSKPQYPCAVDSHVKTVNRVTMYWCGCCVD